MKRSLLVLFCTSLLVAGCSRVSFIGQRFDNFSAYYNTFYNAEKALEEGVTGFDVSVESNAVDQNTYISLFGRSEQGVTQRQPFEDAVLKSADVLRKHPNSKWVDDATLTIGKSWFFTLNFVGAEQKFQELLALDSPLQDEARFWLARTYIASGAYDDAYDHLLASLGGENLSRNWEAQYRLALAELLVVRENWEEAAEALEAGLPGVRDSDLASRAVFLLGQVYETLEEYDLAVEAYDEVLRHNPWYELGYAAQYSAARVLAERGDPEAALERIRDMERDDKNYEYRAQLEYLRGRAYQAQGYFGDALDIYDYLLYDEDGRSSAVRGQVHYALGTFYRDDARDFQLAAAHFDTARTSLGGSFGMSARGAMASRSRQTGDDQQQAPGAITDSEEQSRIFSDFADVMDRIQRLDSLLYLGSLPDSTFEAIVLELRQERAREMEEMQRQQERQRAEAGFRGGANLGVGGMQGLPPGKDIGQGDMGFLYHRDQMQMQQAHSDFVVVWGDRPLARNWRRIEAVMAQAAGGAGADGDSLGFGTTSSLFLPEVDVSDVPRDSASQVLVEADRALAWYELGNVLLLSMSMPDSAAYWYRRVVEEHEEAPVARRAYYAIGEVQRALGDSLGANRIYREILSRFPETPFAARAADRLGLPPVEPVITDTLILAEQAYSAHVDAWEEGDYGASMHGMMAIAQTYPNTPTAPRALMASGKIYMQWAVEDSLDLFAPLPLDSTSATWVRESTNPALGDSIDVQLKTVMEVLQAKFPEAEQVQSASAMVDALDERWAAIMAPLDSLRRVDSLLAADSLAVVDSLQVWAIADSIVTSDPAITTVTDSLLAAVRASMEAEKVEVTTAEDAPDKGALADESAVPDKGPIPTPPNTLGVAQEDVIAGGLGVGITEGQAPRGVGPGAETRNPSLGNIDWSPGGYTIVIYRDTDYAGAVGFARNFGQGLPFPIDIFTAAVERGQEFRVGMGLFYNVTEAQQAMRQAQGMLPEGSEIVLIPKQRSQ